MDHDKARDDEEHVDACAPRHEAAGLIGETETGRQRFSIVLRVVKDDCQRGKSAQHLDEYKLRGGFSDTWKIAAPFMCRGESGHISSHVSTSAVSARAEQVVDHPPRTGF